MAKKRANRNTPGGKGKSRKPNKTAAALKSDNLTELKTELQRVNTITRENPASNLKNKAKRRELVLMRNSMKKKIKSKIRRKKQKIREEHGDEAVPDDGKPQTIESLREKDETFIDKSDDELIQEDNHDEYSNYFNKEYEPQVLITTSIAHTDAIYKFVRALKEFVPNSYFYYRKKFELKKIVELAKEKGFTDIIVVYERVRKPYRMVITHLDDGPTAEFKLSNVVYHDQIPDCARNRGHFPELIFKNFNTKIGHRISRIINGIFPHTPELEGRQVATFHNQRDYIFVRNHRFNFDDEFSKVSLQEIGPRFAMRLLSIQKGTFDNNFGEYEWLYKDKMGVRRRKFNL